jgi:hypothetical protein
MRRDNACAFTFPWLSESALLWQRMRRLPGLLHAASPQHESTARAESRRPVRGVYSVSRLLLAPQTERLCSLVLSCQSRAMAIADTPAAATRSMAMRAQGDVPGSVEFLKRSALPP